MAPSPTRLLDAYVNAVYEFTADGASYRLRPGEGDSHGARWLSANAAEWAFVTACNPGSGALCEAENEARHENLVRELDRRGWRCLPARGLDPAGGWPAERGVVILDRPLRETVKLARELEQSAILHGHGNAGPRVVVLEPSWHEAVAASRGPVTMAPDGCTGLRARGLGFARGPDWVFRDLEFHLPPGRILLAEGANGSGKTTLVRVLAGLLEFHAGKLSFNGDPVAPGSEALRCAMLYLGHRLSVKDDMTALENLSFLCRLHGQPAGEADCERVLADIGLAGLQDAPAARLSAGQRKRVALARLAMDTRPLWLLDEPYANLDRDGARRVSGLIGDHARAGGLTVLTAHEGLTPDLQSLERLSLGGPRD